MLRTTREIKSFSGVSWGQKPQVKLAGGPTYQEVILDTNLTPDQFFVELFVNGDPRFRLTGEQLVMLERYKKIYVPTDIATAGGKYVVPIGDFANKTLEGQMVSGLETKPSDNLILKVTVDPEPSPNTQGNVTLSAEALVNAKLEGNAGAALERFVPRITEVTFDAGQTGRNILDTLTLGPIIKRMHFNSANVTNLRIFKDKRIVWERSAGTNDFMLKRRERAPQTGYFHFDPIESGFALTEWLRTSDVREKLEFEVTVSSAGTIPILMETLEPVQAPSKAA
jgi:hypothetical protein